MIVFPVRMGHVAWWLVTSCGALLGDHHHADAASLAGRLLSLPEQSAISSSVRQRLPVPGRAELGRPRRPRGRGRGRGQRWRSVEDELQVVDYTRRRPWQINRASCPPALCVASVPPPSSGSGDRNPSANGSSQEIGQVEFPFFEADILLDDELDTVNRPVYERQQAWLGRVPRPLRHRPHRDHAHRPGGHRPRPRRSLVKQTNRLWTEGVVPYELDSNLPVETRQSVESALTQFSERTCVQLRPKADDDSDYIFFAYQPGCWSNIGRVGGRQLVSLGPGCEELGTVLHEMMHAVGFWHEQSRPDRDEFVKILYDNVEPGSYEQFEKRSPDESTSLGYAYDYHSITHYGDNYFSLSTAPTIQTISVGQRRGFIIGQRRRLSDLDVAQINALYSCFLGQRSLVARQHPPPCPPGWMKDRLRCYEFVVTSPMTFYAAARSCRTRKAQLVAIGGSHEDEFLSAYLASNHPDELVWRTGALRPASNNTFFWYRRGTHGRHSALTYTAWSRSHDSAPSPRKATLVLRRLGGRTAEGSEAADGVAAMDYQWEVEEPGTAKQPAYFAFPFICEKKANMACFRSADGAGADYRGHLSHTSDGISCQRWTRRYPHEHSYISGDPADGLGDHNHCRNPGGDRKRPWCFSLQTSTRWQYCDVPICSI